MIQEKREGQVRARLEAMNLYLCSACGQANRIEKREGHLFLLIVVLAALAWWMASVASRAAAENECWRDYYERGWSPPDVTCR